MNGPSPPRFDPVARLLHWTMAFLLIGMLALGYYAAHLKPDDPASPLAFHWHRSLGVLAFVLAVIRLSWRLRHPLPPFHAAMPAWERPDTVRIERGLYLLMLVIPVTGYLASTADGQAVRVFGLELPALLDADKARGTALAAAHFGTALVLASLASLHILSVLKHHYLDRDGLLSRMW
ncbi:MAG: cytochrome b [Magnetococcales bacterium]|nr:cytochrome b [Magnetococcales bacterium]MBF0263082.1 cytochrome b [Magnetococcales bacterium]